jgi:hypothetical protein
MDELGEGFLKAFHDTCSRPSGIPSPNQEQEQEQEQDIPPSEGERTSPIVEGASASAEVKQSEQATQIEPTPTQVRTNPRLEIFAEEYRLATGQDYIVGNFQAEGGAAKRTCAKIPDESLYRQAVRAYLAQTDKRLADNGFPFLWFVRELNRWVTQARGGAHARDEFEFLYE